MTDPINDDFGLGSRGQSFAFSPGHAFAGDAWCFTCNAYVPSEVPVPPMPPAPPRYAPHGCAGNLRPVVKVEGGRVDF